MWDRLLMRLAIDSRGYRALLRAYAIMDLRGQQYSRATASRAEDLLAPMVWVVAQLLCAGAGLSALLYGRVDASSFAAAHLLVSTLVVATAVVVEFGEVVLDESDLRVIAALPVAGRTYAAARLTNLVAYALLMWAALGLAPSIVGASLPDGGPAFFPAYAAAALAANLAAVALVILYYLALVRGVPSARARTALAWTQIAVILGIFYGAQLVFKDGRDRLEMWAFDPPAWWRAMPFARLAECVRATGPGGSGGWGELALALVLALGTWGVALLVLARRYAEIEPAFAAATSAASPPPLPGPGRLVGPRAARWLAIGTPAAQAGYGLVARALARDPEHATRALPTLATLPLLLVLGYAADQLADPWIGLDAVLRGGPIPSPAGTAISIALVYALGLVVPPLLFGVQHGRNPAAAWVLRVAPIADPAALFAGVQRAVLVRQAWPLWATTCGILGAVWGRWDHALLHGLAGALVIEATAAASALHAFRDVPFGAPHARGEMSGTAALVTSVIGGVAMGVGGAHYRLLALPGGPLVALGVLLAAAIVARARTRRGLRARFGEPRA